MRNERTLLFSALLLVFASFAAFHMDSSSTGFMSITGFDILDTGCGDDDTVFFASSLTNAHAATFASGSSYSACALVSAALVTTAPTRTCAAYGDGTDNLVLYLSGDENAHAYVPETNASALPSTAVEVCYDGITCQADENNDGCATLSAQESKQYECVASLSSLTNAHVQACDGVYPIEICCAPHERAQCGAGTTLCQDGSCRADCSSIGLPPCDANGVCDLGEGCTCADCDGEQDSCGDGLICDQGICATSADSDGDGLADTLDNCPFHPNNGVLGTCVDNATKSHDPAITPTICTPNGSECGTTEYCELTQANEDGDSCGNACDIDSSDVCTCAAVGDVCAQPGACDIALASGSLDWSNQGPVDEGTSLTITLTLPNDACDGVGFSVSVYDSVHNLYSTTTPQPIGVSGTSGSTTWNAEHNLQTPSATQQWGSQAYEGGNPATLVSTSGDVSVNSNGHFCGDGTRDPGEQCDDGNNVNFDGCSEDCKREGSSGGGPSCTSYCAAFSCICEGTSSYKCCGDYDGDGCFEYGTSFTCNSGQVCSNDFGMCIDPSCEVVNQPQTTPSCVSVTSGWVCGKWSECGTDNKITRTCLKCGSGTCVSTPVTTLSCDKEQPVKGHVFGSANVFIVIILLLFTYVLIDHHRKKKRK